MIVTDKKAREREQRKRVKDEKREFDVSMMKKLALFLLGPKLTTL